MSPHCSVTVNTKRASGYYYGQCSRRAVDGGLCAVHARIAARRASTVATLDAWERFRAANPTSGIDFVSWKAGR